MVILACFTAQVIGAAPKIGIYNDAGAWYDGVTAIESFLYRQGIDSRRLTAVDINTTTQLQSIITALWMPGGWAYSYNTAISPIGMDHIRSFISTGGSYLGTCAGAYFACETVMWSDVWPPAPYPIGYPLQLFRGQCLGPELYPWPTSGTPAIDLNATHPVTRAVPDHKMLLYGGGSFTPYATQTAMELGHYVDNNHIMGVTFSYGSGKVLLMGTHPELEYDNGMNHIFLTSAVHWSLGLLISPKSSFDNSSSLDWISYEKPGTVSQIAGYSWVSSYQGKTGILKLSFSNATQGIKLTSLMRFTPDSSNPWYRMRITFRLDTVSAGMELLPSVLMYSNHTSYAIKEIYGSWIGNSLITTGQWLTMDLYASVNQPSGQLQLLLKNNGFPGNIYMDSIQLEKMVPPAMSNPTWISYPPGTFNQSSYTAAWGYQLPGDAPNGMPQIQWLSSASFATSGILNFHFTQSNQGIKMTSTTAFTIPANRNAAMYFYTFPSTNSAADLQLLAYLYAEKNVQQFKWELEGYANLGQMMPNQWNYFAVPLSSINPLSTYRLQLLFKSYNSLTPLNVAIDDWNVLYSAPAQVELLS